jgi:hypothetical protein
MSATERQLNASDILNEDQLRMMALSLIPHLNRFGIEERPLRQDKVAEFLDCSEKYIIRLRNEGKIKGHRFEGEKMWYYYPSEINLRLRRKS